MHPHGDVRLDYLGDGASAARQPVACPGASRSERQACGSGVHGACGSDTARRQHASGCQGASRRLQRHRASRAAGPIHAGVHQRLLRHGRPRAVNACSPAAAAAAAAGGSCSFFITIARLQHGWCCSTAQRAAASRVNVVTSALGAGATSGASSYCTLFQILHRSTPIILPPTQTKQPGRLCCIAAAGGRWYARHWHAFGASLQRPQMHAMRPRMNC